MRGRGQGGPEVVAKQRVSKTFLTTMKEVVIEYSKKKGSATAREIYSEMQNRNTALTQAFNASDLAHGKSELSRSPHDLKFKARSYLLQLETIPQVGKNPSQVRRKAGK